MSTKTIAVDLRVSDRLASARKEGEMNGAGKRSGDRVETKAGEQPHDGNRRRKNGKVLETGASPNAVGPRTPHPAGRERPYPRCGGAPPATLPASEGALPPTGMIATQHPSRQGTRAVLTVAAGTLALLLGCGPPGLSRGVWLSADGPEQWALTFEHTGGLISGTMHLLREGKQVAQWGFAGTRQEADGLELTWVSNNTLSLTVDLGRGELRGTAVLTDGSVHDAVFRRVDGGRGSRLRRSAGVALPVAPAGPR